ncbi:MAG: DUF4097 family beta strand repeat-containing protein [Longimicrobiales bacterium]
MRNGTGRSANHFFEPIRRHLRVTVFSLLAALTLLASSATRLEAQRSVNQGFAFRSDGSIRIYNLAGSVKVTAWHRDSVAVTGTIVEPSPGDWFIGGTPDGAKLGVWSTETASNVKPSHLELRVPRNAQVWVKTASAEIVVIDVTGGVDANSISGAITVSGNPRELYAESLGGDLTIDASTRALRARTASGDIHIRGQIRDVTASSVSGNLTIEGDQFERGSFESVDGDIRYIGNVGTASALDFINHGGAVEFLLPATAAGDFSISTFYGAFDDQFGVSATSRQSKLRGTEVSFTIGAGGGQVTVRNFKGRVVLRKKG